MRFASEVAGCEDLGTTGRGSDMQVRVILLIIAILNINDDLGFVTFWLSKPTDVEIRLIDLNLLFALIDSLFHSVVRHELFSCFELTTYM